MKETQITVIKLTGTYFYTAWRRKVYFIFRGRWKPVYPMHQTTYEKADQLIKK